MVEIERFAVSMQPKAINTWAGFVSILWMVSWFIMIHYVMVPNHIVLDPFWLCLLLALSVQLIPGLLLAIAGAGCGSRAGRVCANLAIGLFLWFVWYGVLPIASVMRQPLPSQGDGPAFRRASRPVILFSKKSVLQATARRLEPERRCLPTRQNGFADLVQRRYDE